MARGARGSQGRSGDGRFGRESVRVHTKVMIILSYIKFRSKTMNNYTLESIQRIEEPRRHFTSIKSMSLPIYSIRCISSIKPRTSYYYSHSI